MCYLLSTLNKRRYILIFNFGLGPTSQPCCCFVLGYDGKQEVDDGAPIKTTLTGNMEQAVDAEVVRVAAETHPESGGFANANDGRGGGSHDTEEGLEEV
jgi:hypothetical protein